jgi:hypothetical protein
MIRNIRKGNSGERSLVVISAAIRRWLVRAVTACAMLLVGAGHLLAAELSFKPSLAVSEEYTDNVFENNINKRSDYITLAQPGLTFKYNAPFWDWDLGYAFDYRTFAKKSRGDEMNHNGNLKGLLKLVDEKLFLDVSDSYKRVSMDVTRDATRDSLYQNQSDQNVGTVSPYLVLHPTSTIMIKTGYRYVNTWYKDPKAVKKQDHIGFLETSYEVSPRFFANMGYTFTKEKPDNEKSGVLSNSFMRHEAYLGPRYEYAEKSFIFAQGGAIITKYSDRSKYTTSPFWSAGITHTFDSATANLNTAVRYSDDPLGNTTTLDTSYNLNITRTFDRGALTLLGSYTEFSDADTKKLKNRRYTGGITGAYELVQDLRGTFGFTYEYYNDILLDSITRKYFGDCGLSYNFGKDLTLGLTYKHTNYSSATIAADNYKVNHVILEVKKVF